jgi:protein tyrosine phosphatase type 4A
MIAPTNKPTLVQWDDLSFVIMDAPNDSNLHLYLKELKKYNVTDLVRACEVTYNSASVEAAGIKVHVRMSRLMTHWSVTRFLYIYRN